MKSNFFVTENESCETAFDINAFSLIQRRHNTIILFCKSTAEEFSLHYAENEFCNEDYRRLRKHIMLTRD